MAVHVQEQLQACIVKKEALRTQLLGLRQRREEDDVKNGQAWNYNKAQAEKAIADASQVCAGVAFSVT